MIDLERLLPDETCELAAAAFERAWDDAHGHSHETRMHKAVTAMRQSLAPAFEQAKEDGRREALRELNLYFEAPPAAAAPEQTPDACSGEHDPCPCGDTCRCRTHLYCGFFDDERRAQIPASPPIDWESRCRQVEAERDELAGELRDRQYLVDTVEEHIAELRASRDKQTDVATQALQRWVKADEARKAAEASLATLTAELTEANGCEHLKAGDGCSCELLSRHDWAEGHHAQRERANRAEAELTEARAARERAERERDELRARIAEHDGAGNAERAPHHRVAGGDPNG